MTQNEEQKGRVAVPGSDYYYRQALGLERRAQAWPPMPRMPANDNDLHVLARVGLFVGRHLYWLIPTLVLATFSLFLLGLRA